MIKKLIVIGVFIFLLPGMALAAIAVPVGDWTGSRSTSNGSLTAADGWSGSGNNGFEIAWSIALSGSTYTYGYTLSGEGGSNLSKELSHWILQVSSSCLVGDFSNVSPSFSTDSPKTFVPTGDSGDQPNMPANLYGLKWEAPEGSATFSVSFDTTKDPVWGHFYAKDGSENIQIGPGENEKVWATAWNIGFGSGTLPDETTTDFTDWIPTPDNGTVIDPTNGDPTNGNGTTEPIPEPTAMALFGLGSLGLFHLRKKSKK